MNILQKWRDRRAQKKKLRELATVSSTFATLDRLMASGLLSWQPKTRQMLIAEPLATIFMQTAEKWQAFIQNLYRWTYYQQCQEAWEKFFEREELKAVRLAMEDGRSKMEDGKTSTISHQPSVLTREGIDRIRRARRAEIAQSDMPAPKVQSFEFFCVRDTKDKEAQVVFVGHFDPDTDQIDMATWDEVQRLMQSAK
jgi:hypothetical protein